MDSISAAQKLESIGADLIVIACNTAHCFYEELQRSVRIPILNIVTETIKRVSDDDHQKIGLLCSESTNKLKLYQEKCVDENIEIIAANESQQKEITKVIETIIMTGNQGSKEIIKLKQVIQSFVSQGAEAVILGCTEIPLAINQTNTDVKLFDTLEILIKEAIDISLNNPSKS